MRILLLFCFLAAATALNAQTFEWAKSFGGTSDDEGFSICLDAAGNVYTAGTYAGTVDFDPGVGTNNLTAVGGSDNFVQKMDASGNFLWARSFGGTSADVPRSINVDANGNIFTTGTFQGTADFDPGTGVSNLTSVGAFDIYVQKMDASGNFLWAKSFGGPDNDLDNASSVDASGNVYTTGYFDATVDFDPGTGTAIHTSAGLHDFFVQKMDASGNFVWVKTFRELIRSKVIQ